MLSRGTFLSKSQIFSKTNNKQLWVPEAKELDKGKMGKASEPVPPFQPPNANLLFKKGPLTFAAASKQGKPIKRWKGQLKGYKGWNFESSLLI